MKIIIITWLVSLTAFLIVAVHKKWIKDKTLNTLASIVTVVSSLATIYILVVPFPLSSIESYPELKSVPHLIYEMKSNYSCIFFMNKEKNIDDLKANLVITNSSNNIINNIKITVLLFKPDRIDESKFLNTYILNNDDYIEIGSIVQGKLKSMDSLTISIDNIVSELPVNTAIQKNDINLLLFPKIGKKIVISSPDLFKKHFNLMENIFDQKNGTLRHETYGNFTNVRNFKINNSTGLRLKIIVEYEIKNIRLVNILFGGLFYLTHNQANTITTLPLVIEGLWKLNYSAWAPISSDNFSLIFIPQKIMLDSPCKQENKLMTLHVIPVDNKKQEIGLILPVTIYTGPSQ